jgi:hypothetical protein
MFPRDEDVREKIDTYFPENKFEVRIHILTNYINEEVLLDLDDGLSVKLSVRPHCYLVDEKFRT